MKTRSTVNFKPNTVPNEISQTTVSRRSQDIHIAASSRQDTTSPDAVITPTPVQQTFQWRQENAAEIFGRSPDGTHSGVGGTPRYFNTVLIDLTPSHTIMF